MMFNENLIYTLNQVSHTRCYLIGDYNIWSPKALQAFANWAIRWHQVPHDSYDVQIHKRDKYCCDSYWQYSYQKLQCSKNVSLLPGLLIADISDPHAIFHMMNIYIKIIFLRMTNFNW